MQRKRYSEKSTDLICRDGECYCEFVHPPSWCTILTSSYSSTHSTDFFH